MAINLQIKGNLSNLVWTEFSQSVPSTPIKKLPPRIDPYLVWFDSSCEKLENALGRHEVDLLVELPKSLPARYQAAECLATLGCRFRSPRPDNSGGYVHQRLVPRIVTVSVRWRSVAPLIAQHAKWGIVRFELASARYLPRAGQDTESDDKRREEAIQDLPRLFLKSAHVAQNEQGLQSNPLKPSGTASGIEPANLRKPYLLVIDDFCNFAASHLHGSVKTLWHQGKARAERPRQGPGYGASESQTDRNYEDSSPWEFPNDGPTSAPPAAGRAVPEVPSHEVDSAVGPYGAFLNFTGGRGKGLLDLHNEVEAYRQAQYHLPVPHWTHGTAVLSVLSRRSMQLPDRATDGVAELEEPKDIHFVQLPEKAVLDTSGGSLASFAIDAIHRAARMAAHNEHGSVIVNLSYGTHSGPHDGSSMFESAMLDLLDFYDGQGRRPELHIVVPAGNSHLLRCHACGWLTSQGTAQSCQTLFWKIQPDDDTDSFVELWLSPGADVEIELILPSGESAIKVTKGLAISFNADSPSPQEAKVLTAAVIYPEAAAQGERGTMVLIAAAPTLRRRDYGYGERYRGGGADEPKAGLQRVRMEAPAGVWQIKIRNLHPSEAAGFHAWVQRDDAAPGRYRAGKGYRGRQSYFLDPPGSAVEPRFTLNGIATAVHRGRRLWVVGSMDEKARISRYASAGPDRALGNRCSGPDVVTVADGSRNNPGREVGGTFSGSRLRLAGTSISAAVFTRMLHEFLRVSGPGHQMTWVPGAAQPQALPLSSVAGEPQQAPDFYRGELVRLRHARDVVLINRR
jgi:hypothetical protein